MTLLEKLKEKISVHAAYRRVFGTEEGQAVIRHLMREGFVTRPTFVAGDPNQTLMNEGSRRLVLSILRFTYKDHGEMVNQITKELENAN